VRFVGGHQVAGRAGYREVVEDGGQVIVAEPAQNVLSGAAGGVPDSGPATDSRLSCAASPN
jgi:hypothetical protein